MSYGRYLRELLAPLRLYDLEAPFNGGELNVQGGALDGVDTWLAELRRELPHTFFLVPGYGAQGGGAKDVAPAFDANGRGAIVNASRSILCAWQKQHAPEHDYAKAAAAEAVRMRDEIVGEIGTIK